MAKLIVYVAGPLSAETEAQREANVERAMQAGYELLRIGHAPIIPHLSHYFDLWHERSFGERGFPEDYMQWDFALLQRCDGVLFLGSSPGADREVALAKELGLPVWGRVLDVPVGGWLSAEWEEPA